MTQILDPSVAAALVAHNDSLRSAFQVAKRRGAVTNWDTLLASIDRTLTEYHAVTNYARGAGPFTPEQREALEPFATAARRISPDLPDTTEITLSIGEREVYRVSLGSLRAARTAHAERLVANYREMHGLPETPPLSENVALERIAAMMGEFVDNWPRPKRFKTALALIAKTLRAALDGDVCASADTLPKGGDAKQAPCASKGSAVPEGETPR